MIQGIILTRSSYLTAAHAKLFQLVQAFFEFLDGNGLVKIEALGKEAVVFLQQPYLFSGFNALITYF